MQQSVERWQHLVGEVGLANATRMLMAENPGQGDSVTELDDVWEDMSVFQIYEAILAEKPLHPAARRALQRWGEVRAGPNANTPLPSPTEEPVPVPCNNWLGL